MYILIAAKQHSKNNAVVRSVNFITAFDKGSNFKISV